MNPGYIVEFKPYARRGSGLVCLALTLALLMIPFPVQAASERVQREWREESATAHPAYVVETRDGGWLVCRNGYEAPSVVKIDAQGQVVWNYSIQANSAVELANGNILIADSGAPGPPRVPRVLEVTPAKKVVWQYSFSSRAEAPRYAERTSSGSTLVTTPQGVLEISPQGKVTWSYSGDLVYPVAAHRLPSGNTLIVDKGLGGGGKVIEVDHRGQVIWRYGDGTSGSQPGQLVSPVEAMRTADGLTMIADRGSYHLLSVDGQGQVARVFGWEDFLKTTSVATQWSILPRPDGSLLLVFSYTNGKSTIVELDNRSVATYLAGQWFYTEVLPVVNPQGVVLVPLRDFYQFLGGRVEWDAVSGSMAAVRGDSILRFSPSSTSATINGQPVEMPAPPLTIRGQTLVSLETLQAALPEVEINWDAAARVITIPRLLPPALEVGNPAEGSEALAE